MPDTGSIYISILILMALILTNAYFAMSEIAILSSNQNKMKRLSEGGEKRATQLLKITESSSSFLATIQVGVTISGLLASAVAADKFSVMLANSINIPQISRGVIEGFSLVAITIILSYFTLIFGELVPKRVAMKFPDKIALSVASPLTFLYKVLKPFVKFLAASTNGFLWLIGIKTSKVDEELVTQEDILMMIEQGEETGSIHGSELQMIQNIFELDDKIVSEVMSHRTEIAMISVDSDINSVIKLSREEGYSRIPIFDGDCDDIIGIVHIKDLIGRNEHLPLRSFLRKPIYVPEGKLCSKLLLEFQDKKTHMAIVIDEYGGTAGLVTLEDLIEIIVGSIQDESDNEPLEIEIVDENTYIFDGGISIEEIEKILSIKLSDDYDCETIAGYVIAILGSIPDEIAQNAVRINDEYVAYVYELDDRRISRVKVIRDKFDNEK
ncbi:MAG: hemolysin family protein [Oscillospiraceae bacterium]